MIQRHLLGRESRYGNPCLPSVSSEQQFSAKEIGIVIQIQRWQGNHLFFEVPRNKADN